MSRVACAFRAGVASATILVLAAGCGGNKVEVRDNYDPDTDWSSISSFVWFGIQARGGISEFDVTRIANAIRADMRAKGLREVGERTGADVGLAAYLGVLPKAVDTWKSDGGILWTRGKDIVSAGALVVDVIDLRRGKLIWQGAAERQLAQNPSRSEVDRNIRDTVKKLLADFPPR